MVIISDRVGPARQYYNNILIPMRTCNMNYNINIIYVLYIYINLTYAGNLFFQSY